MELKVYTREEVFNETLKYFNGDVLATDVWINKYCIKDSNNNYYELTPNDMHHRLTNKFYNAESEYENTYNDELSDYGKKRTPLTEEKIFNYFKDFKYISPQGSVMSVLGNPTMIGSLSNCIVLPKIYDSYGGITYTDQQLTQLFKRRCVSENSYVKIKNKGLIKIKDVNVGDYILSKNINTNNDEYNLIIDKFNTNVEENDRVIITLSNGSKLKTSKKHPILTFNNNGYKYVDVKDLKINDIVIKPSLSYNNDFSEESFENDISWFIGHHLGDGNSGYVNIKYNKNYGKKIYKYKKVRFRILGDNKECIKNYKRIHRSLLNINNDNSDVKLSTRKYYKSDVWEYSSNNNINSDIIIKYFDNQIGNKTYSSFVPSYIKKNNTWIPFLAGIIDADGYVKDGGTIELSLANKNLIDEISSYISSIGLYYNYNFKKNVKRLNEHGVHVLLIHYDELFVKNICKYLVHTNKKTKLENYVNKYHSKKIFLSESEKDNIISDYNVKNNKNNKLSAVIKILKKDKKLALSGYETLYNNDIIELNKYDEIKQRLYITNIEKDFETTQYYDIEVDKVNNFYSGNFGLINVHNCGVGIDISTLRPNNSFVNNSALSTTGAVSFMERYSNTTREVAQNSRRGALMISIDVNHPDVLDFIKIKRDLKKITGANISIQIRDEFMKAVLKKEKYVLRFPVDSSIENAKFTKEIDAEYLWNEIIKSAHSCAEPGIIFKDRQHKYSTSSIYPNWENISTNPCSEIAMNNDSCRLMVVNYFSCVDNPFTSNAKFNFNKLYEITYEAQRLMDDLVDLELTAVDNIIKKVESDNEPDFIKAVELKTWKDLYENGKNGRRTGLGFTALGDTIAALGFKYDSENAIDIINEISKTKMLAEFDSSVDMAIQRGKFKDFDPLYENKSDFIKMIENEFPVLYSRMMKHGRRNISISTVAPTGSLSILTQSTSGIEPLYTMSYKRRKKVNPNEKNIKIDFVDEMGDSWSEYNIFHPKIKMWMDINNIDYNSEQYLKENPYFGSTANEINWINRIKIQSIIQKYVTHSISSTINLPTDVSESKVSEIYVEAWKQGLKGITVYRDGSRDGVLISDKEKKEQEKNEHFRDTNAPKRPKRLKGDIIRFQNNLEKWIAVVGLLDGRPYELFTGKLVNGLGKLSSTIKECEIVKNRNEDGTSRYDLEYTDENGEKQIFIGISQKFDPQYWNLAKMISGNMRHGMPLVYVHQLIESLNLNDDNLNTWKNGVARVVKRYIKDGVKGKGKCPECGSEHLEYKEGCLTCMSCGHSKCS
jgi:ribonucleoside-diphosphate reductase alpha chain